MTPLAVFTALLPRLESVGGQIRVAQIHANGYFVIESEHPDVMLIHDRGEDTVQIRCDKGMFPPTRAHVDVDDIMTVIEGWMKEAGGKCGASKAELPCEKCGHSSYEHDMTGCLVAPCECHERGPRYGTVGMTREKAYQKGYERRPEELRAELLAKKRQVWGVDKPPPQHPTTLRGYHTTSGNPYCVVTRGTGGTEEHWLHTLADAQWMVREAKQDSRINHIELTDHRPGGKEWYYDRDRSGFWKRTVHN